MVEPKKAIVDADVKVAEEAAAAANAIKKECEDALAEAIPILNSAISALDTIKSADIKLVQVRSQRGRAQRGRGSARQVSHHKPGGLDCAVPGPEHHEVCWHPAGAAGHAEGAGAECTPAGRPAGQAAGHVGFKHH